MGLELCSIFIDNLNDGTEYTFSRFEDDKKLGGMVDMANDFSTLVPWQARQTV